MDLNQKQKKLLASIQTVGKTGYVLVGVRQKHNARLMESAGLVRVERKNVARKFPGRVEISLELVATARNKERRIVPISKESIAFYMQQVVANRHRVGLNDVNIFIGDDAAQFGDDIMYAEVQMS